MQSLGVQGSDNTARSCALASASDGILPLGLQTASWRVHPSFYHPISSADVLNEEVTVCTAVGHADRCDGGEASGHPGPDIKNTLEDLASRYSQGESPLTDAMLEVLENASAKFTGDRRRQFLYLWRILGTSLLFGDDQRGILGFLPADSRIPDHSLVDHLTTSSGIVPGLLEDGLSLVGVEIGGIKEFISQSRKLRDVWASSYLVSLIMLSAARVVIDSLGPDAIVFPELRGNPFMDLYLLSEGVLDLKEIGELWRGLERFFESLMVASIPNTLMFFAPSGEAERLAAEIERAINSTLLRIIRRMEESDDKLRRILEPVDPVIRRQLSRLPHPLTLRWDKVDIQPLAAKIREILRSGSEDPRASIREFLRRNLPEELASIESESGETVNLVKEFEEVLYSAWDAMRNGVEVGDPVDTIFYPIAFLILRERLRIRKLSFSEGVPPEPGEETSAGGVKILKRCRLCGLRNPLAAPDQQEEARHSDELEAWKRILREMEANKDRRRWLFRESEPLCAVGFLKRIFLNDRLLVAAWSAVMDDEGLWERLSDEARKALKGVVRRPPTIDEIAAGPLKHQLSEVLEDESQLIGPMVEAIADVAIRYFDYRDGRGNDAGKDMTYSEELISELGYRLKENLSIFYGRERREKLIEELKREISNVEAIPGTLLFENIWKSVSDELRSMGDLPESLENFLEARKKILENAGLSEPSNYVALIRLDGDHIGRWITGLMFLEKDVSLARRLYCLREPANCGAGGGAIPRELLRRINESLRSLHRLVTPPLHRSMSAILRDLSLLYPRIISEAGGFTFYSSGDELLALVPVSDSSGSSTPTSRAIEAVERIVSCFRSDLVIANGGVIMGMGKLATMSGGVAISHRLLPLGDVITRTMREEWVAKEGSPETPPGKRNRISFIKLARGGSLPRAVISGDLLMKGVASSLIRKLILLVEGKNVLSRGFLKDFLAFSDEVIGHVFDPSAMTESAMPLVSLVIRRNLHGPKEARRGALKDLLQVFGELLDASPREMEDWFMGSRREVKAAKRPVEFEMTQLVQMIRLMDFVLREVLAHE